MLTKEEKDFIIYWESHRDKENSLLSKMIYGGPWGLIFALPILIAVIFHDWYKRMIPISRTQLVLISLCVVGTAFFYAYFRQQVRWENNEKLYQELKIKEKKSTESE